ncbi:sensor histidine kinase [Brachybacterium hainanense]|uniref:histidine kinase n=1 Tax=Brachybacterium hainanense TaxID=1541174 RepID=A0ABV6R7S7_9MICO
MTAPHLARQTLRCAVEAVAVAALVPLLVVALLALPVSGSPARLAVAAVDRLHTGADGPGAGPSRPLRSPAVFLTVQLAIGILAAAIWVLIALGLVTCASMVIGAATGGPVAVFDAPAGAVTWTSVLWLGPPGLVLLFLAMSGLVGTCWLSRRARAALSRPRADDLERQVRSLSTTLDDVVAAVDDERRRIERDLHDGVQQRVVALSLLLARADRTEPGSERDALQTRARDEVQAILDDLREVSWRLHPAMLARDGLDAALEALRDRTTLPTALHLDPRPGSLPGTVTGPRSPLRADLATETAAFYVASEAVSNALKHSGATRLEIRLTRDPGTLGIQVLDDGRGGADPGGQGLSGIRSRVAARGGTIHVTSPDGGPTIVEARFPCA